MRSFLCQVTLSQDCALDGGILIRELQPNECIFGAELGHVLVCKLFKAWCSRMMDGRF